DSGIPDEKWETVTPPPEVTHFGDASDAQRKLADMEFRMITNSSLKTGVASLFTHVGLLLCLGLFLAACGTLAKNITTATTSSPPIPSVTPTLPAPTPTIAATSIPSPSPTALPSFPDPAGYEWIPVISGLKLPVDIQNAGDGSGRLFVVEKRGRILIFKDGQLLPTPFLDISTKVGSQYTEQGLLGLAFHPNYAQSGVFFVNYTDGNGNTVIARFNVSPDDPNRADPASEVDLLHVNQPYNNHNGGGLAFGPDGYLYIGLGDGGSEGDPLGNGQNLQTLLGKMLRIDVDHGDLYAIPPDNPFAKGGGLPEIWAYGLRNPWRFSFDRATGNMYIADVGQDTWEEIDFVPSGMPGGMNFGWSYYEGMHAYKGQPPANVPFVWPVTEYSHAYGCAVTGGNVYRGPALPEWQGVYFYGDYCSGNIWGLIRTGGNDQQTKILFATGAKITTFGVDEAGEIYLADYGSGTILRLVKRQ
ncbi:MAG: PQQ-dependent sugar dehydrogenase, partial [Anaerolineales bacterium]